MASPYYQMHIFIAVVTANGLMRVECAEAILKNSHYLRDSGHKVMTYFHTGCYIDRNRNICAYLFLTTQCTDLIFVDSDVSFDADAMLKLIKHDKDIIAGIYPYKMNTLNFPAVISFDENRQCLDSKTGLVSLDIAPTGLMRIQRRVFSKMIENKIPMDQRGIYSFFGTGMNFPNDNTWYGDDNTFCKRWKAMGGEVWCEPDINFTHIGDKKYSGNYKEYITSKMVVN